MYILKLLNKIGILIGKIKIELILLGIFIFLMAVLLIANVVARTAGGAINYIDEVAMILIMWTTFVGMSYAIKSGEHIVMSAVFDICPLKVQKILIFINCTISMVVMFYMAYISFDYVYGVYSKQHLTSMLRIPFWIIYSVSTLSFFLGGVNYLRTIIKNIQIKDEVWVAVNRKTGYSEEEDININL